MVFGCVDGRRGGDTEEEEVIPTKWIEGDVRWLRETNAIRDMKEIRLPDKKWESFKLIKIKIKSCMCI